MLVWTTAGLLALGGCAQLPSSSNRAEIKPVERYESQQAFNAAQANWPSDAWWEQYGDAQLNLLMNEALQDAPTLAMARARLQQAESITQITDSASQPQLSANAIATEDKQTYNLLVPKNQLPQGWNDYGRATLDLHWELDFWGKNRAALAAATSETEATRADLAQARLSLTAAIAASYAELAHLQASRDTAAAAVDVRVKTEMLFHKRYDNGLEILGSVRQVEAKRAAAEAELMALDEQIALQKHRIVALLGAGPDRAQSLLRPGISLATHFGLPAQLSANLLGRRPDIVAARLRTEAAAKRIDMRKAEFYPDVNLSAFFGVHSLGLDMMRRAGSSVGSIGPAISLPIFSGGRLTGQLRGAEAEYNASVAVYDATLTQALKDVADAAVSIKALTGQLGKADEAVHAAQEAYRIVRNRYEGGLATYLDVLAAEDGLLAARRAQTDVQSRAFMLNVSLIKALGGGYQNQAS